MTGTVDFTVSEGIGRKSKPHADFSTASTGCGADRAKFVVWDGKKGESGSRDGQGGEVPFINAAEIAQNRSVAGKIFPS
jgi:hypothetical protein